MYESWERIGDLASELVLTGESAFELWTAKYASRFPELSQECPFDSKEIRCCGPTWVAEACAAALGGTCTMVKPDERACGGSVTFLDPGQRSCHIQFCETPRCLDGSEVQRMAVPLRDPSGQRAASVRVMHPLHLLKSWAPDCEVTGDQLLHALWKLRISIVCSREFARDLLDAGQAFEVLRLNEQIFRLALREVNLEAWAQEKVSPLDAILLDPRLPFAAERYPQMMDEVEARVFARVQ